MNSADRNDHKMSFNVTLVEVHCYLQFAIVHGSKLTFFTKRIIQLTVLCIVSIKRSYILKKNLQLKASSFFKSEWPFSGQQALKG